MNKSFEKNCGIALIVFIILLLLTMVLHPMGGNVDHLIRIKKTIIIIHSIALLSIPFGCIGFWGFTRKLGTSDFFSVLGFAFVSVALLAVLLAATTNGIVLPLFVENYKNASPEKIATIKPILQYSFAVNHAFDNIYTASFCLAILFWSVSILQSGKLPRWIAWIGFVFVFAVIIMMFSGVATNSLQGLRLFFAGIMIWIIIIGIVLLKINQTIYLINTQSIKP